MISRHRLPLLLACCVSLFSVNAGGVLAQAPRGLVLPKQGFQNTSQVPANYSPEEAAAVAVVEQWIETINDQDTPAQMALIDDNIVYRTDPLDELGHGARNYCAIGPGLDVPDPETTSTIQELYVVGGKRETLVLLRRQDHAPANARNVGFLGGYTIPFAVLLRIRDGKIVEFYDAPTNKIGKGGMPFPPGMAPPGGPPAKIPERCMSLQAVAPAPRGNNTAQDVRENYGTAKPEFFFNPYEEAAAQAVRAWFAAWQSGDPLLLGSFVDRNVVFRSDPDKELGKGRDSLLRAVCGTMGGKRKLIDLFVIGGDYDSTVLARWDETNTQGAVTHMASTFRVQNGLIAEWIYDTHLDALPASDRGSTGASSPPCQAVDAALGPPVTGRAPLAPR